MLRNSQIQLAINHTTGPGNRTPNAHRVKSWLTAFVWPRLDVDYGESFDQIAKFIWEKYGIKTMLSDVSIMAGMTDLNAIYYLRPSGAYRLTVEEASAVQERNAQIIGDQIINEKGRYSHARHNNP